MHYAHHGRHGFGNYRVSIWHFQVWASLTKSRHCKYLMDGCTLRIRGMCARSDGPWKTERPVAQTLLVRLLHTSYMCQFPLPCSWLILLFYTDSSCKPHIHLTCANFPQPVLFSCFMQILTYIHTCANFLCPVAGGLFSCFLCRFFLTISLFLQIIRLLSCLVLVRLWWTPHTFSAL